MKKLIQILLIIIGTISLTLGVMGIFLPILPTTPFLLLSAACYLKGSKRMYDYILNHKYLGSYIKNYYEKKGIPLKTKIFVIALLWVSISYSVFFVLNNLFLQILLLVIALLVTYHILSQKTLSK